MMDGIWLAAPVAAMRLSPAAPSHQWLVNPAAQAWRERSGIALDAWSSVADELFEQLSRSHVVSVQVRGESLRWQSTPLPVGSLVWLLPQDAQAVDWSSGAERLALVQEFGAIGTFEFNLQTLQRRWDLQTTT